MRRIKDDTLSRTIFTMQWFFESGATPFVRAAQSSDTALMQLLLKYGADPKMPTDYGDTALTAAAGIGWVEGVTYERSREGQRRRDQDAAGSGAGSERGE